MSAGEAARPGALLLHGQPGGARDWNRVVAELRGEVEAIALARPGWDGRSAARDIAGNAAAAMSVLDAHDVTRATVVGHSFGAAAACWLAAEHPERVGGLVLVAPAANVASLYTLDRWLAAPVLGHLGSAIAVGAPGMLLRSAIGRRRIAEGLGFDDEQLAAAGRTFGRPRAWRAFAVEQRSLIRDLPRLEPPGHLLPLRRAQDVAAAIRSVS